MATRYVQAQSYRALVEVGPSAAIVAAPATLHVVGMTHSIVTLTPRPFFLHPPPLPDEAPKGVLAPQRAEVAGLGRWACGAATEAVVATMQTQG